MRLPHSFASGFLRLASGFSWHFVSLVHSTKGLHTLLCRFAAYRGTSLRSHGFCTHGFRTHSALRHAASRLIGALRFARTLKKSSWYLWGFRVFFQKIPEFETTSEAKCPDKPRSGVAKNRVSAKAVSAEAVCTPRAKRDAPISREAAWRRTE